MALDTLDGRSMLPRMWFLWKGSAAKVRALFATLQFRLQRGSDEAAAAAIARELDAEEFGARIDREADGRSQPSSHPLTATDRSTSDG